MLRSIASPLVSTDVVRRLESLSFKSGLLEVRLNSNYHLRFSNFDGTDFSNEDLTYCDFSHASLRYCDFRGCRLDNTTSFKGADLEGAVFDPDFQINPTTSDFDPRNYHKARITTAISHADRAYSFNELLNLNQESVKDTRELLDAISRDRTLLVALKLQNEGNLIAPSKLMEEDVFSYVLRRRSLSGAHVDEVLWYVGARGVKEEVGREILDNIANSSFQEGARAAAFIRRADFLESDEERQSYYLNGMYFNQSNRIRYLCARIVMTSSHDERTRLEAGWVSVACSPKKSHDPFEGFT